MKQRYWSGSKDSGEGASVIRENSKNPNLEMARIHPDRQTTASCVMRGLIIVACSSVNELRSIL